MSSDPRVAAVAARYLQTPLKVQPDYGNLDERTDTVSCRKEASSWSKLFPRNSYLNKFFAEKRIPSKVFDVKDSHGIAHSIPNGVVVEAIAQTSGRELKQIEDTIRKIDFANGDVNHFLEHLARALAEQYNGALRFASARKALNKYNPDELLSALVDVLEKYGLDDQVEAIKKLTPSIQRAWRSRER